MPIIVLYTYAPGDLQRQGFSHGLNAKAPFNVNAVTTLLAVLLLSSSVGIEGQGSKLSSKDG